MPVWITKKLQIADWGAVHFRVGLAQQEMRSSLHLAMLRRRGELSEPDDVFILLPDETLTNRFLGFTQITENDIPHGVVMLVGEGVGFAKRFPDVAAKFSGASQSVALTDGASI